MPGSSPGGSGSGAGTTRSPSAFQALNPPTRSVAKRKPRSRSDAAAKLEESRLHNEDRSTAAADKHRGLIDDVVPFGGEQPGAGAGPALLPRS